MQWSGSVVLVSGGASGLGEGVVRAAAAGGAAGVLVVDVNGERASALAKELGDHVIAVPTDVRDTDAVERAVAAAETNFGRLDVTACCAGIGFVHRVMDRDGTPMSIDDYRRVIDVNLNGTFDIVRRSASLMARNEPDADGQRGVIVMTASLAAYDGQVGQAAYSASKGGIVGMTLPLARDLAPVGVRVMTIAPGIMDTPIYEFLPRETFEVLSKLPLNPRRMGTAQEFAHLVGAIVENPYLNGEVIRLDAGVRLPPK